MMSNIEMIGYIAEFVSLTLTPPTMILSAAVFWIFYKEALVSMGKDQKKQIDWMMIGICVSFMGGLMDNFYWGIAWTSDFLSLDSKEFWFKNGVYSNVPFRQTCGIIAAFCHIRGALFKGNSLIKTLLYISGCSGVVFGVLLLTTKGLL